MSRLAALALAAPLMLTGCTLSRMAQGTPGTDLSAIQPGASCDAANSVLGAPERTWTSEENVTFSVYLIDKGQQPDAGDAVAVGFLDIVGLGLPELFFSLEDNWPSKNYRRLMRRGIVACGSEGSIRGLFDEFDSLPADGRSNTRPSAFQ